MKIQQIFFTVLILGMFGSCQKNTTANFYTDKREYHGNDTVRIKNLSIGAEAWTWTFSDGRKSFEENPQYIVDSMEIDTIREIKLESISKDGRKATMSRMISFKQGILASDFFRTKFGEKRPTTKQAKAINNNWSIIGTTIYKNGSYTTLTIVLFDSFRPNFPGTYQVKSVKSNLRPGEAYIEINIFDFDWYWHFYSISGELKVKVNQNGSVSAVFTDILVKDGADQFVYTSLISGCITVY